jgi:stress-induced morphogen
MINEVLGHELASGVHALAIHALAPGEVPPPFPSPQAGEG